MEESKIASIKSKYKEIYDIDVDIQYVDEIGEYVIIRNGQIIRTIDSLDKELEQLEN